MKPDVLDLTTDLTRLMDLATSEGELEALLRRGLDWVSRLAPYDLATIFELDGDELRIAAATGPLADEAVKTHALSLSAFPSLRAALETRRARAFREHDHAHGDGDPFDGVLDLPHGHACMVVPLVAGEDRFGVMTLDRRECIAYADEVVQLVEVFGQVLALAVMHARSRLALGRLQQTTEAHARELEQRLLGDPLGVLESSRSPRVRDVVRRARQVAATKTPVLVQGETGTGKERLARALHLFGARAQKPFVTLNCAAIPETLIESELFGHVRGAFTGAARDRPGRFQMANGGTLLLDEVGELPLSLQAKLLRVLQEGTFEPVGSDRTVKVDVRIVAATHVDLREAVERGRFREDLYYRLAVFPLELPPLRERLEDLPELCEFILREQAQRTGRRGVHVAKDALALLRTYAFPGNLRELSNLLERASILSPSPTLGAGHFDLPQSRTVAPSPDAREAPSPGAPLAFDGELVTLAELEARYLRHALAVTGGRIYGADGAAAKLGLPPSTLQSRMKKLGVARAG